MSDHAFAEPAAIPPVHAPIVPTRPLADTPMAATLQHLVRRLSQTLVQYVREAFPWTPLEEQPSLAQLQALTAEDTQLIKKLTQFLRRQRIAPPLPGSFPGAFTTLNFVALHYILPRLAADVRVTIAEVEVMLPKFTDPEASALVQTVLDGKRRQLKTLEGLTSTTPKVKS